MTTLDMKTVARVQSVRAVQITQENIRDVLALLVSLDAYNWRKTDFMVFTSDSNSKVRIRWWEGDYACFANVGEWIVIDEDNEWTVEWNHTFVDDYAEVFDIE